MGEHDGHRSRMIKRMQEKDLPDHEFLEIILFNAIPRRNTNDLAHRLLAEFGSMENVFLASVEQLKKVEGIGESVAGYIYAIGKIMPRLYGRIQKAYYPEYFDSDAFVPYVKQEYKRLTKEVLDVYMLDENKKIVGKARFGEEGYFNVEMQPEQLTKALIEFSPAGIVLVHNHPFGEAVVSESDEHTTKQIQLICSLQNVMLCDHIVYAPNGVYSYYLSGKMQEISSQYSVSEVLGRTPIK